MRDAGSEMSCLMFGPSSACASGMLSRTCHSARACSRLVGDHRVGRRRPSFERGLEQRFEQRAAHAPRARRPTCSSSTHHGRRRERSRQLREVPLHQRQRELAHHLEAGQRGAGARAARAAAARAPPRASRTRRRRWLRRRLRKQLQGRGGDDAERALAADEEVAQLVAGVVLAQAASGRPRSRPAASRPRGRGTARAHCRSAAPACRRRWWRGCRRWCSCPRRRGCSGNSRPARRRRLLHRLQHAAGLDRHREVGRVDRADAVHAARGSAAPACRSHRAIDAADEAGVAALRHDRRAVRRAGAQHRRDLVGARRPHHGERAAAVALAPVELPAPTGRRRTAPGPRRAPRAGRRAMHRAAMDSSSCAVAATLRCPSRQRTCIAQAANSARQSSRPRPRPAAADAARRCSRAPRPR